MSLAARSIQWLIVTGLTYPLSVVYSIVLARWLGPVDRGEFAVFLTIANMLAGLLSLGMGIIGRVEVARASSNFRLVHSNLLWVSFLGGLLLLLFLPLAVHVLPYILRIQTLGIVLVPFIVVALVYSGFSDLLFQGIGWFRNLNLLRIIKAILELALLALILILLKFGLWGAIVSWTTCTFLLFGIRLMISMKSSGSLVGINWGLLRRFIGHGSKILLSAQAIGLQVSAAVLLLRYYHPGAPVGFFAVAMGLAMQIGIFWGTFSIVASDRIASSNQAESKRVVLFLNRGLFLGAILILLVLYPVSDLLVSILYGNEFQPAGRLLFVLTIGILLAQLTEVNSQYLVAQPDGIEKCLKLNMLNFFLCLILIVVLIPVYGAGGAALALAVAYALNAVAYQVAMKQLVGCKWKELCVITSADIVRISLSLRRMRSQVVPG